MQVKIFKPCKTPTQSGKKPELWHIKPLITRKHKDIDQIMGWTSNENPFDQLLSKLQFVDLEDAIKYAKNKNWHYEVIEPRKSKIIKKSYSNNFIK